jgi:hypothetical protein
MSRIHALKCDLDEDCTCLDDAGDQHGPTSRATLDLDRPEGRGRVEELAPLPQSFGGLRTPGGLVGPADGVVLDPDRLGGEPRSAPQDLADKPAVRDLAQPRLLIVPLTTAQANRVVAKLHRHHGPCPPALVYACFGVTDGERLRGCAILARPANRNSDDGQTAEVIRVATDGCPNACSALYGAAARAAREMGFARIMTYTLDSEGGASLRGAGWTREEDGIESWWHRYPEKNAAERRTVVRREHHDQTKTRWVKAFRARLDVDMSLAATPTSGPVPSLFGGDQ